MDVHIRWMIRRDMPEVLDIESQSFDHPWPEDDFIAHLRQRNVIGMVAEDDESVLGFFIYAFYKNRIHILNLAVHPSYRRQGIGRQMIKKIQGKMSVRRQRLILEVNEYNVDAQKFYQAMGFRWVETLFGFEGRGDSYRMEYRHPDVGGEIIERILAGNAERM